MLMMTWSVFSNRNIRDVTHRKLRTKNRTKNTENRTESTETEFFGTLFGSWFLGIEFTKVNSILYLEEPNLLNCAEFECSYIINSTILVDYICICGTLLI